MHVKRIKIMHLITGLGVGGAEAMLIKLLSNMDRGRYENVVVSMTGLGTTGLQIRDLGFSVYSLEMKRGIPSPRGILELYQLIRHEKPSILHTWMYHANLLGWIVAKISFKLPIIWGIRCSVKNYRDYSLLTLITAKIGAILSCWTDIILINSHIGYKKHIEIGYSKKRMKIIPNGFDPDALPSGENFREKLRMDLGLPLKTILIGMVARYHREKGHLNFLKAAVHLAATDLKAAFVMVGKDVDENNKLFSSFIKEYSLSGRIFLLGERDDVPAIYAGLDIVTSASHGEGFPNVVGEAMAAGIPCVVTDAGDSAKIVGETGFVVPVNDPIALSSAWRKLIEMGEGRRIKLGKAARKRIEDNYSIKKITNDFEDIYMEVVNGKCKEEQDYI